MGYEEDLRLEIKFVPIIKKILGLVFIKQDKILDQKEGTDFLTFLMRPFKIGLRLRTFKYYEKYSREFTIRNSRPSGIDTEIHKIKKGLISYIFYGFVNKEENLLIQYFIGDLDVFRFLDKKPKYIYKNNSLDSTFAVYDLNDFPNDFIIKYWNRWNS